jgi:hypothetical protein
MALLRLTIVVALVLLGVHLEANRLTSNNRLGFARLVAVESTTTTQTGPATVTPTQIGPGPLNQPGPTAPVTTPPEPPQQEPIGPGPLNQPGPTAPVTTPPGPGNPIGPGPRNQPGPTAPAPRTIEPSYSPMIDPARFSTTIDNPYLPLVPGTRFIYEATTADGKERNVVEVTYDTKTVMGVQTRVVHDVVTGADGEVDEDTSDWYAQDADGNVWYFGEDTQTLGGPTVDTSGSFTAGVDGALPGIIMPGSPVVGDHYRQEYYVGKAEDTGKVLSLTSTESAPVGGTRSDLLVTEDVNPLDPAAAVEHKYFAKGIGHIVTVHVTGPSERVELVAVERF